MLLLSFFITLPYFLFTQEEEAVDKKVRIKTVQEKDGETIVKDTTFTVTDEDEVKKYVQQFTKDPEGDSTATIMVDVMIDADEDFDGHAGHKKIIIKKSGDDDEEVIYVPHGSGHKVMTFKSDDGDEEKIIIMGPHGKRKVIKWKSDGGDVYEYDYDFDIDMESFHKDMAELNEEMRELQIRIMDEQGHLHDELIELKHLEELERLKEIEVIVAPPAPHEPFFHDNTWTIRKGPEVTDEELREAGIKNKPDRLELDEIEVLKEDGVVDLSFKMMEEGNPRVEVYNIYGDKVFSGKPELMNEKYEIKMDLSKKQYGTYYMQIISGNSSKTLRLKL
jgi:hypothetical protein